MLLKDDEISISGTPPEVVNTASSELLPKKTRENTNMHINRTLTTVIVRK